MKKILFPTDFSETADRAFVYALKMADKMNAQITTLHVWQPVPVLEHYAPMPYEKIYEMLDLANFENYRDEVPHLRALAQENDLGHIKLSHVLDSGLTERAIVSIAEKEQPDLIIMGTQGASGLIYNYIWYIISDICC